MRNQPTVAVPPEVLGAIRHALELNLVDANRRYGAAVTVDYDLYPDVVAAVKWVHALDDRAALALVQDALTNAAAVDDGPSLVRATLALSHGLTQPVGQSGAWTTELAEHFVSAALIASWKPSHPASKESPA